MRVLITGFDPFRDEQVNPSWEICKMLQEESMEGVDIKVRRLPVVFKRAREEAIRQFEELNPDLVLHLGEAGGRTHISVERVAINCDDAGTPDNDGQTRDAEPIQEKGEDGLFATVPVKKIVKALKKSGIPAVISNSAGTYVCNHVFYGMLHHIKQKRASTWVGFIHLPYLPEQTLDKPQKASMDAALMVKAVKVAIITCLHE
ncbi:MAG: pyroglutamyl-peptidase I [Theionarchaea archaeon]|nr:pyroglutamyl-peptidase I [Theionarchaea archaeon]